MPEAATTRTFLRFGGRADSTRASVFCFAHAGGTASTYAPWSRALNGSLQAAAIEIVGIEQPGHGMRMDEELCADVPRLANGIARSIQQELMRTPRLEYGFYGHSLGAVIAFETARVLARLGVRGPGRLFVGACRTPEMPPVRPTVGHLLENEFIKAVQQRYGGIPAAVLEEPELLEMILPVMRADFAAYENYRYQARTDQLRLDQVQENRIRPDLGCPITAFAGMSDPVVRAEDMAGWAHHTSGPFHLHAVPGDHFFMAQSRDRVLDIISGAFRQKDDGGAVIHPSDEHDRWLSTSENL